MVDRWLAALREPETNSETVRSKRKIFPGKAIPFEITAVFYDTFNEPNLVQA